MIQFSVTRGALWRIEPDAFLAVDKGDYFMTKVNVEDQVRQAYGEAASSKDPVILEPALDVKSLVAPPGLLRKTFSLPGTSEKDSKEK
jgi:hypothetical protein